MKRNEKMTAPRMLEAVYKRLGKPPRVKMIVGTREAIESLVGGPFELDAAFFGGRRARERGRSTTRRRGVRARRITCTAFAARSSCWGATARNFAT